MTWGLRLLVLATCCLTVLSCGGASEPSEPTPRKQPQVVSTRSADSPFTAGAVWKDADAQARVEKTCRGSARTVMRACVRGEMQREGASAEVIDFYDDTVQWLLGFAETPGKLRAGLVLTPGAESPIPQIGFLRGTPNVQRALDIISDAFPTSGKSFGPFQADPMYPALLAAAQRKFQNADDPLDLKHFDIAELETSSVTASGGQLFIVQVGIHNFCLACGIGVAERYSLEFDAQGSFQSAKLAGLCQGRLVTQDVQGIGKTSFHDFSGVKPGRGGVTEPYLVEVPGLPTCPEHVTF